MATQQGFAQQFPDRRFATRLGKPAFSLCPVPWPELFHRSNPTVIREPHKSFATVCCAFQKKQWNQHITFTDNCTQNTLIKPEHAWTNSKGHRKPQETEHALPLRMWFNWFSSTVSFKHAQLDCLVCCPIVITHNTPHEHMLTPWNREVYNNSLSGTLPDLSKQKKLKILFATHAKSSRFQYITITEPQRCER